MDEDTKREITAAVKVAMNGVNERLGAIQGEIKALRADVAGVQAQNALVHGSVLAVARKILTAEEVADLEPRPPAAGEALPPKATPYASSLGSPTP